MSECVLKTLACRGLRVGPSKVCVCVSLSEILQTYAAKVLAKRLQLTDTDAREAPRYGARSHVSPRIAPFTKSVNQSSSVQTRYIVQGKALFW